MPQERVRAHRRRTSGGKVSQVKEHARRGRPKKNEGIAARQSVGALLSARYPTTYDEHNGKWYVGGTVPFTARFLYDGQLITDENIEEAAKRYAYERTGQPGMKRRITPRPYKTKAEAQATVATAYEEAERG